jgi:hypothetical protein
MTEQPAQGLDRLELTFGDHPGLQDGARIGEIQAALLDIIEAIAVGATP